MLGHSPYRRSSCFILFYLFILNFRVSFQILDMIFTDRFQSILCRGSKNILSLLSCGALSSYDESRASVKGFADRYVPNSLLLLLFNLPLPLAVDYSKKSCVFRMPTSSHRPHMDSSQVWLFLISFLTDRNSKTSSVTTRVWALTPISSSLNVATLQRLDGPIQVHAHWDSKSTTNAPIASDWKPGNLSQVQIIQRLSFDVRNASMRPATP